MLEHLKHLNGLDVLFIVIAIFGLRSLISLLRPRRRICTTCGRSVPKLYGPYQVCQWCKKEYLE